MDRIWHERRVFVPGIVFLAVLAIAVALSDTLRTAEVEAEQGALAGIAVVIAAGIAGFPLGLICYMPFGLLFRWPIAIYAHLVRDQEFCTCFLRVMNDRSFGPWAEQLDSFRTQCESACRDPQRATRFRGFLYERFAPEAVRTPARRRWETVHTIGGMVFAIIFGLLLSYPVVSAVDHGTAWWEDGRVLASVLSVTLVVLSLLVAYAWVMAREAGLMEEWWWRRWLELLRRKPEILQVAAVDDKLNKWLLSARMPAKRTRTARTTLG